MKNVFHYMVKITSSTDGKTRNFYRVLAVETSNKFEAAELAKAADPQYVPSTIERVDLDVLAVLMGCSYGKTHKGSGEKVHLAYFRNGGGIDNGPICGSGTCNYGFKREMTQNYTKEAVTCAKCLKYIKEHGGLQ